MGISMNFALPEGFEQVANELGQARAAARPVKVSQRASLLGAASLAVKAGNLPALVVFKSAANQSYNRHAEALHALAQAGDLAGLKGYRTFGANTYGKALSRFRDLLVIHVEQANEKPAPKKAPAKAKRVVKAKGKGKKAVLTVKGKRRSKLKAKR